MPTPIRYITDLVTAVMPGVVSDFAVQQPTAPALYIRVQLVGNYDFSQCSYAIFIDADNNKDNYDDNNDGRHRRDDQQRG